MPPLLAPLVARQHQIALLWVDTIARQLKTHAEHVCLPRGLELLDTTTQDVCQKIMSWMGSSVILTTSVRHSCRVLKVPAARRKSHAQMSALAMATALSSSRQDSEYRNVFYPMRFVMLSVNAMTSTPADLVQ